MAKEDKKPKKRPTAEKRLIQNKKRREENKQFVSRIRTSIRRFLEANQKGEGVQETLNTVYSMVDKGVKKGLMKKNKGSRIKARLTAKAAANS